MVVTTSFRLPAGKLPYTQEMPDPPLPSEPAPQPERPLRLTIGVLLLWMTTTAMALGLAGSVQRSRDDGPRHSDGVRRMLWAVDMLFVLEAPAYGAALAAAATAAYRAAMRIGRFPSQPGHWIAVMLGIATLGFFAAMVAGSDGPTRRLIATAAIVMLAVVGCRASVTTPEPRRWRAALLVNAIGLCVLLAALIAWLASGLEAHTPAFLLVYGLPSVAIGVAVLLAGVAAVVDLAGPSRNDVFHWVGIVTLAMLAAHPVIERGIFYWYH
jgi:hypothetical protein